MSVRDECNRITNWVIDGAVAGDYWCKTIDELFHKDDPSILWNNRFSLFRNDPSRTSPVSAYKTLNEYIYQKVICIDENNIIERLKKIDVKTWSRYFAYLLVIPFLLSKLREKFYYQDYSFFCPIPVEGSGSVGDLGTSVCVWLINHKNFEDKSLFQVRYPSIIEFMDYDTDHLTLKDLIDKIECSIFCGKTGSSTLSEIPNNLIKLIDEF